MTDSRVTPQAAAEEREHVALTAATYALWRYDYRGQTAEWFDGHHPERWHWERAEAAVAAAAPFIERRLQDEIDRLTQQNEQFEGRISHLRELCGIDKFSSMEGFAPEVDRLRAEVADLGEQIAQQIEQIPTGYGSGSRRDVNRVIGTAADIARAAASPVGTGNPTEEKA